MRINRVYTVFFSPCGSTKKIACNFAVKVAKALEVDNHKIDFTLPRQRDNKHHFRADDLVVFAMPVYAGRVPNMILPYVKESFLGENTPVILISVFGNRNYDDSLIELKIELEKQNFKVISAAAIVSRHVFSDKIANGRPDQQDQREINQFAATVIEQIKTVESFQADLQVPGNNPIGPYYTPLGVDSKPTNFLKAKPNTYLDRCIDCKACVNVCPMGSISEDDVSMVPGICIKCQACIQICPTRAKYFSDPEFLSHIKMLEINYSVRSKNIFINF